MPPVVSCNPRWPNNKPFSLLHLTPEHAHHGALGTEPGAGIESGGGATDPCMDRPVAAGVREPGRVHGSRTGPGPEPAGGADPGTSVPPSQRTLRGWDPRLLLDRQQPGRDFYQGP